MTRAGERRSTIVLVSWPAGEDAASDPGLLVADVVRRHGGRLEPGDPGNEAAVAFGDTAVAVGFVLELVSSATEARLAVSAAVHVGSTRRGAAILASAHPDQVLVSAAASARVADRLPGGASLRDLGFHLLNDLGEPEDVRQLCHPNLPDGFPPLRSLDRMAHNLPTQLTSFVGRDLELAAIDDVLRRHRLVTLTGAGGCGKTRLAVHAVARWVPVMQGGVWFVDLADVPEATHVGPAIASAMSLTEQPMQPAAQAIASRLGNKGALLVLDNCDHVVEGAAEAATALIGLCPGLRVVTTGREPLGVDGEVVHRVPSLELPRDDEDAACEAVRLFQERATAVRPTFVIDDATVPSVTAICRRLDGLPLAIELAAGWCRVLSAEEISRQLSASFGLLRSGRRGVAARHQTLETSLRWSYDLLAEPERVLLRRLSVFAGGFTLDAAEDVASDDEVDRGQVIDLLRSLVDRSLVQHEHAEATSRYRLLETIREFAAARLAESHETAQIRDRHLSWLSAFAERTGSALFLEARGRSLEILADEVDNLRTGFEWALESDRVDTALRAFAATGNFWNLTRPSEGYRWAQTMETAEGGDPRDRALGLLHAALSAWAMGDLPMAQRFLAFGAQVAKDLNDALLGAAVTVTRAQHRLFAGDPSALEAFDEVAETVEKIGNSTLLVTSHVGAAVVLQSLGRLDEAAGRAQRAIELCAGTEDHLILGLALDISAIIAMFRGRFEEAHAVLAAQSQEPWSIAARSQLRFVEDLFPAWARSAAGEHSVAAAGLRERVAHGRRFMLALTVAFGGWLAVWLSWRAGDPPDDDLMRETDQLLELIGFPYGRVLVGSIQAEHLCAAGALQDAEQRAEAASTLGRTVPLAGVFLPLALNTSARVALARGQLDTAESTARQSLGGFVGNDMRWGIPEALETLAAVFIARGADEHGTRVLGAADRARTELGWSRGWPDQRRVDDLANVLAVRLGRDAYAREWNAGTRMSIEEAVKYAGRGRGPRKRVGVGWESLTPTERQVADLAATGLRNAEIAAKLFMTGNTVKSHLGSVYTKLGVRSRAHLAAQRRGTE